MWFLIVTLYVVNRVPMTQTFGPFPTLYYCEEEMLRQAKQLEGVRGAQGMTAHCEMEM